MRKLNRFAIAITGLLVVIACVCFIPQRGQSQTFETAPDARPAPSTSAPVALPPAGAPLVGPQPKGPGVVVGSQGVVRVVSQGEGGEYTVHGLTVELTLDDRTREVLTKYPDADEADRPALVEKLTTIINVQFDERQTAREQELVQLEQQIKKLRALHDQRAKEKKEIVQDRVRQLLRDASGLGWGSNGPVTEPNANFLYKQPGKVAPLPYGVRESLPAKK